jgi:glycosyltransferase involved in cell wall biosynthesis
MPQPESTRDPAVSVVIPAYNAESCVGRAIRSVLVQTHPVREIIVVDDGSRDATRAVVQEFGVPVRYIHQVNAGVSAARNHGIREAVGEWIAFLDADDEWLPDKLGRQVELLKARPDLRWCGCSPAYVRGGEATPAEVPASLHETLREAGAIPFFEGLRRGLVFQTSGVVVEGTVLAEAGGFDESLRVNEDRDLWWRIAFRYPSVGYCPQVSYHFVLDQADSLTKQVHDRSPHVQSLCRHLRDAESARADVRSAFRSYARKLALDYLVRAAVREITIGADARDELLRHFPLRTSERVLLGAVRLLPRSLAIRIVRRFSL